MYGTAILFPTRKEINQVMDLVGRHDKDLKDALIDYITGLYVSAFKILYPASTISYHRLPRINSELADQLNAINLLRIEYCLEKIVPDRAEYIMAEIDHQHEQMISHVCMRAKNFISPHDDCCFAAGLSGSYQIHVSDIANGHLVRIQFSHQR